ncbi:MAG TPA: hypothetical protein VIG71_05545 [Enteractinococcus sp.]
MTKTPNSNPEDASPHGEESSAKIPSPPPPPEETNSEDVGLATEMVFSGQQREQLRNAPDYETFETGVLSFDDEELYQDVKSPEDEAEKAQTELNITEDQSDVRTAVTDKHGPQAPASAAGSTDHQNFGEYQAYSFDPHQQDTQKSTTTNEPFALAMFIVLTLAALGIFGILLWLVFRVVIGT